MNIESLTLEHYRNVQNQTVRFSKGLNILYGENGAGKTNLLEAVSLFAVCKSHRTAKDTDFIAYGSDSAHLSMQYASDFDRTDMKISHDADIRYFADGKKSLFYEGVRIGKVSEFIGRFRAVLFTPDHLSLIKGAPEERRRFCDMALSQIKPGYIRCLNDYYAYLSRRNALLKEFRENGGVGDRVLLMTYTEALSKIAGKIMRQRILFSRYIQELASDFYRTISGDSEKLYVRYYGNIKDSGEKDDLSDVRLGSELFDLYERNIETEIRRGMTRYGPHRDDFLFFMGKTPSEKAGGEENYRAESEFAARTFASQGQQRSAVLALKLSEGDMMKSLSGEQPVYLFDDVLSELDPNRRERFLSIFHDKQVLLTCCDESAANALAGRKIAVRGGNYTAVDMG